MALNQSKNDPAKTGRGLAIAGIAVSIASFVLLAVLLAVGALHDVLQKIFH